MKNKIISIISSVFVLGFIGACEARITTNPPPAGMGTLEVHLTDAPSCGYDHVYVTVDHIELSIDDGGTWETIPISPDVVQPIDLLTLDNGVLVSLGEAPLAAGTYEQVRLVLAPNTGSGPTYANAVVRTGETEQIALTTPSAQQSGFKILGPITIEEGGTTDLVLDFNACKSIVVAGNSGNLILKPVVTATAQVVAGTISGFALPGSQVYAYAEPAGTLITAATADSTTGQFNLGPILATTDTTSVDVVIVPLATDAQSTIVVQDISVVAGETTWISSADGTFPFFNDLLVTGSTMATVEGTVTIVDTPGAATVTANQTITASGRSYEIASTTSSGVDGTYTLTLPSFGVWVGTYNTTLPLALTQDVELTDAGIYSIVASDEAVTSDPIVVDISGGGITGVDFTLSE